jgi:hypothetical protein
LTETAKIFGALKAVLEPIFLEFLRGEFRGKF